MRYNGCISLLDCEPLVPTPNPTIPAKPCIHGSRLGREHTSLATHLVEDNRLEGYANHDESAAGAHGLHDRLHDRTWAYAFDLPHRASAR